MPALGPGCSLTGDPLPHTVHHLWVPLSGSGEEPLQVPGKSEWGRARAGWRPLAPPIRSPIGRLPQTLPGGLLSARWGRQPDPSTTQEGPRSTFKIQHRAESECPGTKGSRLSKEGEMQRALLEEEPAQRGLGGDRIQTWLGAGSRGTRGGAVGRGATETVCGSIHQGTGLGREMGGIRWRGVLGPSDRRLQCPLQQWGGHPGFEQEQPSAVQAPRTWQSRAIPARAELTL